jgi:Ser/Thr protein kinase RdoA (MazF antagonist)
MESHPEVALNPGGRTAVYRRGSMVVREASVHTPAVHALLRHLEQVGFAGAPRLVGSGLDDQGRETLTFLEGEVTHPGPWSLDGVVAVGRLLRGLHEATASFIPPPGAVWFDWHGRDLGQGERIISHRDAAPWNIVARDGLPVGLIDWEFVGPVDPLTELAQVCWLNAKLHDDIVAEREGLPSLDERARQLRAIVDGYGLPAAGRRVLLDRMVEFVVSEIAWEADDAGITSPEITTHPQGLWAMAWRARAAAWLLRHRRVLENALS